MRKTTGLFLLLILFLVFVLSSHLTSFANLASQTSSECAKASQPYSLQGPPTIQADLITQVLNFYHSPARGLGENLYDLGEQACIDPAFALAFFMHESLFGTTGEARVTLSLGNERCIPGRACINTQGTACQKGQSCFARMNSWQDGFEKWYQLIKNLYIGQWGRVTVDQVIPKYAPSNDGNDEAAYIAAIKHTVDIWRAGGIQVI